MDVTRIGLQAYKTATQDLARAGSRLVRDPGDIDAVLDTKIAEKQAKVGAKLAAKGDELFQTLLDVLA